MSERVNFYDFKSNWSQFEKFFNDEEFIRAVNIFHWWGNHNENGIEYPLVKNDRRIEDDPRGSLNDDEDVKYVIDKLEQNYSKSNPYWFSYPGECMELNNIITFTLLKLMFPDKKFYSTKIYLGDDVNFHNVITTREIEPITEFSFDPSLVDESEGLILYDLIYPFCYWFGKTFDNRKAFDIITVSSSTDIEDEWYEMNYNSYYEEHGIPFDGRVYNPDLNSFNII